MAIEHLRNHIFRPTPGLCVCSRRLNTAIFDGISLSPLKSLKRTNIAVKASRKLKFGVRLSLAEQSPPKSTVDVQRLVDFLYDDLPHLFDDKGIDRTAYDERVTFRDPITRHDTISGYLFNIALLKKLFQPDFNLHWVKQVYFSLWILKSINESLFILLLCPWKL